MLCKILLLLSVLGVLEVFAVTTSFGELQPRDLLVFDQLFHQKAVPGRSHVESFEFSTKHGQVITAIHVTDLTHQQDGGRIRINCGGVGYTYVKLQTISECTRQILLNIEIFVNNLKPLKSREPGMSVTSPARVADRSQHELLGPIH